MEPSRSLNVRTAPGEFALVRCEVVNAAAERSVRMVELREFRLWQYMMVNRHGIAVTAASLGLWVDAEAFLRGQARYERAGAVEPVDRLEISVWDAELRVTQRLIRYLPAEGYEVSAERLLARLRPELGDRGDVLERRDRGYLVVRSPVDDLSRLQPDGAARGHAAR